MTENPATGGSAGARLSSSKAVTAISLDGHDAVGVRADNPGPFTLTGTNSWIVGRDPCVVIDPGPALAGHLERLAGEIDRRGGLAAILLTHDHADHAEAVPELRRRYPRAELAAARGEVDRQLADGDELGPLRALASPGHSPDHLAYVWGDVGFTGDAVLGTGSVFITPDPGALAGYLTALERLAGLDLDVLAPGHGPVVGDPATHIRSYIEHRLDRERRLVAALDGGLRTVDELLDRVWSDAPVVLRPAATVTLAAHLDKLEGEDRLPAGVERPTIRL